MTIKRRITASRTPLFAAVRRALHAALAASAPARVEQRVAPLARREFIKRSVTGAVLLSMGTALLPACMRGAPRVAIVGAGIAGLNAAYVLKKAGVQAAVYEASDRAGGRILTARDAVCPGVHAELGGEFIDPQHADMFALMQEFGLEITDRKAPGLSSLQTAYFFGGRHYSEAQILEAFKPLAERLAADAAAAGRSISYTQANEAARRLDALSLSGYLDRLEVRGWLRDLIQSASVTEFGLDADQQSALNLITTLDTGAAHIARLDSGSMRYVVKGGNEQLTQALAQRLESQLRLQHSFEMIKQRGAGYTLLFRDVNGNAKEEQADAVIFALPFSLLREASIDLPLSDVKRKVIEELGYGSHSKLLVGFKQRVWRVAQYSGDMYTDEPVNMSWEHGVPQAGECAGMTFMLAGRKGVEVGHDPPERQVNRLMVGLERAFPGARTARNEKTLRFHWPSHPYSKGSRAGYTVGQWTSIAGAEMEPAGKIFFAGEHCSRDFQGTMNGAAETGRRAAQSVLAMLGK